MIVSSMWIMPFQWQPSGMALNKHIECGLLLYSPFISAPVRRIHMLTEPIILFTFGNINLYIQLGVGGAGPSLCVTVNVPPVVPRRSDPFCLVIYYIKWVTTSWTDSK